MSAVGTYDIKTGYPVVLVDVPINDRGELGELGENISGARATGTNDRGEFWAKRGEFSPPNYPIDALGPLAPVAKAIAEHGQLDIATAGQSVLGVAALLVQGRYDVQTLSGIKPTSLYLLSIMDSGDGKSTAEEIALQKVTEHEKSEAKRLKLQCGDGAKGEDTVPEPYLTVRDATVEGIRRSFSNGVPSQGAFTSEAAVMLCGWGMSAEQRAKTAGTLNGLWDNGALSVTRGGQKRIQLYNRRFSAHWMIQPDAATEALHDPLLSNIGFWPRFLIAWPSPMKPRLAKAWQWWDDDSVKRFWGECDGHLQKQTKDEAAGIIIKPDEQAMTLAGKFFERMEQEARDRGGKLRDVKPFAIRATEQAFRVAGVLAGFEGETVITVAKMKNGILLASHSLETWQGIFGKRQAAQHERWARLLHKWMLTQADGVASETAMLRLANPKELRHKDRRDTALAFLQRNQFVARAVEYDPTGSARPVHNTWRAL